MFEFLTYSLHYTKIFTKCEIPLEGNISVIWWLNHVAIISLTSKAVSRKRVQFFFKVRINTHTYQYSLPIRHLQAKFPFLSDSIYMQAVLRILRKGQVRHCPLTNIPQSKSPHPFFRHDPL